MPFPTKKKPVLVTEVLERLSAGEPLAAICRRPDMPDPNTWRNWCDADEALGIAYARARDIGFDAIAVEALNILDGEPERVTITSGEDRTETRIDPASVQRAKNRFEGRLKLLAKWDPKRYGERVDHTSSDGSMSPTPTLADFYGERPAPKRAKK